MMGLRSRRTWHVTIWTLHICVQILWAPAAAFEPGAFAQPMHRYAAGASQRTTCPTMVTRLGDLRVRSKDVCRRDSLAAVLCGGLGLTVGIFLPSMTRAASPVLPLSRSLVNLLRIRSFISTMATDLSSPDAAGERVTGLVKYVVKDLDMRGSVEDASRYLPGPRAEEAKRHGFESFEYMGQIVEFTGYDELKKPGISRFALLTSPERVDFARRCLDAAGRELDAFFSAFDGDAVAQAKEIYAAYFGPLPS